MAILNDIAAGLEPVGEFVQGAVSKSTEQSNSGSSDWPYIGPEPDSATKELLYCLGGLLGAFIDGDFHVHDNYPTEMQYAEVYSNDIARCFEEVNPAVTNAWHTVGTFTASIESLVSDTVSKFSDEIKKFIESTQWHEKELQQAAINASEAADEILKNLQSSFSELTGPSK